jgi:hypothetical protein
MIFLGLALGLIGTFGSFAGSWGIINLASASSRRDDSPGLGAVLIVVAFLVKLPVVVALGLTAQRIGPACMNGFLVGLGISYFALVTWGIVDGLRRAAAADPSKYVVIEDEPEKSSPLDD